MTISQGCLCGGFFDFIYMFMHSIGTCMPIFIKIDREKNQAFFIQSKRSLFLGQTVHVYTSSIIYTNLMHGIEAYIHAMGLVQKWRLILQASNY